MADPVSLLTILAALGAAAAWKHFTFVRKKKHKDHVDDVKAHTPAPGSSDPGASLINQTPAYLAVKTHAQETQAP